VAPISRDPWYKGLRVDDSDHMASILDTPAHDRLKAKLAAGYGGHDNVEVEGMVDQQILKLIKVIRSRYLSKGSEARPLLDFSRLVRFFTMDVITCLDAGSALGFFDADSDLYGYTASVDS
jgi:hypothetical protein